MNKLNLFKYVARSWSYIRRAYSIISIPMQFLAYTSLIYYELIIRISWLKIIFPIYTSFFKVSFIFVLLFVILGYIYTKKTNFVKEDIEISTEINPYANYKIPRVQFPSYRCMIELFRLHHIDTKDMEKILENSLK